MLTKQFIKGLCVGVIFTILCTGTIFNFSDEFHKYDIVENGVKIKVDNDVSSISNFIINGRTYIQIRDLCGIFNKDIDWDSENKIVHIKDKMQITPTSIPVPTPTVMTTRLRNHSQQNVVQQIQPTVTPQVKDVVKKMEKSLNFRNVTWGINQATLVTLEGKQPDEIFHNGYIYKHILLNNVPSQIVYGFNTKDQLRSILIQNENTHDNLNGYLTDFNNYQTYLQPIVPIALTQIWVKDNYENQPAQWNDLFFQRLMSYRLMGSIEDTELEGCLIKYSNSLTCSIVIRSTTYPRE